jgi:hypothetical protein
MICNNFAAILLQSVKQQHGDRAKFIRSFRFHGDNYEVLPQARDDLLTITNMATLRNFEIISGKFKVIRISRHTDENYEQKWITTFYTYQFVFTARYIVDEFGGKHAS